MTQPNSPRALGYRPVGEWERNAACITAWPAHAYAWGDFLARAQTEFTAFCHALLADQGSERMLLLVSDADAEADARRALGALAERVDYCQLAYGDIWLRDTGPIFLRGPSGLASVRFGWNGWGGKYLYPGDSDLSARLATHSQLPCFAYAEVLEGGAVEFDGQGTCLTTESCLLNPNRGHDLTRAVLEPLLSNAFGVDKVLWLREGLVGDHTDGHIDNLARFVAPGVVMHMHQSGTDDPNAEALAAIATDLAHFTDAAGRSLQRLAVPSPGRVLDEAGCPIAASYMNFYVGNRVVVVPAFDSERDEPARRAIAAAFPGRRVVSSPARAILEGGGGTFHCMTRQQPEPTP